MAKKPSALGTRDAVPCLCAWSCPAARGSKCVGGGVWRQPTALGAQVVHNAQSLHAGAAATAATNDAVAEVRGWHADADADGVHCSHSSGTTCTHASGTTTCTGAHSATQHKGAAHLGVCAPESTIGAGWPSQLAHGTTETSHARAAALPICPLYTRGHTERRHGRAVLIQFHRAEV